MTIYMQLTGISGDVTDKNHTNWIAVDGYHVMMHRFVKVHVGQSKNRDSSLPQLGQFELVKAADKSSVPLMNALLTGKVMETCQLNVCHSGKGAQVNSQYTLSNALVSHYEDTCNKTGLPKEFLRISYTKIQRKYTPYDESNVAGSPVLTGYDVGTATAS